MWLLGFSLWKSIQLFGPVVYLSDYLVLNIDDKFENLEYNYRQRIDAIKDLIGARKCDLERARYFIDILQIER